ncbi:uncharacterized protein LOC114529505 [Dendronephthya gigantea]|uniref:uncharacterized protein LOC114529505 n=1 Tax=Dendronephthya gigantea TaxID=151771 RepID=UPI00106ACD38|nr:uncharacterized protein LOC114529505 [Dendronephthya gigantea]XP_028407119.1 uncharacterized protein LOC114529505 [Dendronephthya gigantea]XP_028407120.1 uncharacterized protein LOC114529505 [Dendronephthya gigantea]XP_028407121.1 uncharacterized protein LOC114529505 [Dendronephthya gigantea]
MTFLGAPRSKDTREEVDSSESVTTSDRIWREVEFESDVEHREMTQTYASDDYLSRWLPNIKQAGEPGVSRKEIAEKRQEKDHSNVLYKSPCRYHEGRKLTPNDKKENDPSKKTYFEAIKCSPMKLRQSIATFKRPKLDENFNVLKPKQNLALHPRPPGMPGPSVHAETDSSTSMEPMELLNEKSSILEKAALAGKSSVKTMHSKTAKAKTSLGIVEMRGDNDTGQLGSLCFRKGLNNSSENVLSPGSTMVGGKLRRVHRGEDGALLTGRNKSKELLVRCESIMIYPKVLINQKQQSEKIRLNTNIKEQVEENTAGVTRNQVEKSTTKPEKPREAWKDSNHVSLSKNSENYTRLPQLTVKEYCKPEGQHRKTSLEEALGPQKGAPDDDIITVIQTSKRQPFVESKVFQYSTKIIIPFGEDELKIPRETTEKESLTQQRGFGSLGGGEENGERGAPIETRPTRYSEESNQLAEEKIGLVKPRCLKESSKLNQQIRVNSDLLLQVRQPETARTFPVATQYLTVTTPETQVKRFRIPTGGENTDLFVGRENHPPKAKSTGAYRFSYNQRGLSEYNKGFDGIPEDDDERRRNLKIGGKGLLKARLARQESERLLEDECKKRVQFLVNNSR